MNTLRIPITRIGDEGCYFEEHVRVTSIQPSDAKAVAVETATIAGNFERLGAEFLFRGHITGVYEGACVRCLEAAQAPFDAEVAWVFAEGPAAVFEEIGHALETGSDDLADNAHDTDVPRTFQGHDINLAPYVWEEVVFAQPSRFLCHEECAGLCPRCGTNRNYGACKCVNEDNEEPVGNHGLAALADMFPELAPKKTKE